jgi:Putative MetA-pathway of phenol degradation
MHLSRRLSLLVLCGILCAAPLACQMPFYTDNPDVTDRGTLHFEFFNEFDGLQSSQLPDLRQNTANFKFNYGLPHNLELDVDAPYLSIYRAAGSEASSGFGDTDMGVKWNFRKASRPMSFPALASSLYIEFPTGNTQEELGSGLSDYWLNFIAQEPFTDKTRITGNFGFLFAGNTSTGVLGIQTTRGHVYTGGLSLLHDLNPRVTLGGEVYGGIADNHGLGKDQIQGLLGGEYELRNGFGVTFAVLGGAHVASPKIGGQVGFEVDFPAVLHRSADKSAFNQITSTSLQWRSP